MGEETQAGCASLVEVDTSGGKALASSLPAASFTSRVLALLAFLSLLSACSSTGMGAPRDGSPASTEVTLTPPPGASAVVGGLTEPPIPLCSRDQVPNADPCAGWHPRWAKVLHVGTADLSGEPWVIHDAINAGDPGPLAITGWLIVERGRVPVLCEDTLTSYPPMCAPPFVIVEDIDLADVVGVQESEGVTFTGTQIVLEGTLRDPDPEVAYACVEGPPDLPEYIWTCVNSQWVNEYRDPNASLDPEEIVSAPPRPTP